MKKLLLLAVLLISTTVLFAGDFTDMGSDKTLIGRWRWTSVELTGRDLETGADATSYLITLEEDGSMKILADCRQGSGSWRTAGNVLTLSVNSMTTSSCGANSYADQLVELLDVGAFKYSMDSDTQLELSFAAGAGTAKFLKTNDAL